uniref:Uncharacterized protein n=3 Tax=Avena sativa TaxID=4498 RepID=A0ACD6AGJ8_AVESA
MGMAKVGQCILGGAQVRSAGLLRVGAFHVVPLTSSPAAGSQLPSRTASTPLRCRLRFAPDALTATVAMDPPVKLDEKRRAELMAQLKQLKAELKELEEERSLPCAKVTDGDPNKLSEMDKLGPFLAKLVKKNRAALRKAYRNREPLILRLNSREDP